MGIAGPISDPLSRSAPNLVNLHGQERIFAAVFKREIDPKVLDHLAQSRSPRDLVTLAATVGLASFTSRFNVAFEIELP